jgi:hypothetical protein
MQQNATAAEKLDFFLGSWRSSLDRTGGRLCSVDNGHQLQRWGHAPACFEEGGATKRRWSAW